jgi:hypothetical protein
VIETFHETVFGRVLKLNSLVNAQRFLQAQHSLHYEQALLCCHSQRISLASPMVIMRWCVHQFQWSDRGVCEKMLRALRNF